MLRVWEMKQEHHDVKLYLECDLGMRDRTMRILDQAIQRNQSLLFNTVPLVIVGKVVEHQMTKPLSEAFTEVRVRTYEIHALKDGNFSIMVKGYLHTSGLKVDHYDSTKQ